MKIKTGDNIIVITGKDKGKTGKVSKVITKKNLVLVPGVNVLKKHQRPSKKNQKGQIIDIAMPIHISNVMIESGKKGTRIGYKVTGEKKVRIAKSTGKEI